MSKVIIASNRLPRKVVRRSNRVSYKDSAGGLATGLASLSDEYKLKWIGWPGVPRGSLNKAKREQVIRDFEKDGLIPLFLTGNEISNFYHGFCNRTIWPLFHYFIQYAEYHRDQWEVYERINQRFLDKIIETYEPGDMVWVHDYHLMLLPRMIRDRLKEARIGFFLHIPFPSYEIFRLFPWRKEILEGLLGADIIGFHTYDYVTHFLSSVRRIIGYEHDLGVVGCGDHLCRVDAYPMGIDYEKFSEGPRKAGVLDHMEEIRKKVGGRKIILSIDRLDYSKGILNRLESFERLLEKNPDLQEKVTLILVAVPSREKVDHYEELKSDLDEKVGYINGKFAKIGWSPVWYIYRFLPFELLLALYRSADVCLITPVRDGMNLMAKEFLAVKEGGKGVLVLSEMAGAAHELGESLIVNPNDFDEVSEAIGKALTMPEEEQLERLRPMQERLKRYDIRKWGNDFFSDLARSRPEEHPIYSKRLIDREREELLRDFKKNKRRLLVLDYDGTLTDLKDKPEQASPDREILDILKDLSSREGNEVVLISGRDRKTLDDWFRDIGIRMSAEHGVWMKEKDGQWKLTSPMTSDWKGSIRNLLEVYTDRTPGSFIEEKDYSLVWHYRRTHPEMGSIRSRELIGDLLDLTANTDLGILEGSNIIEVKKIGINKGTVINKLLDEDRWDTMLVIGDDITDEDMFGAVPPKGCTIKVGLQPTKARYNVESVNEVRRLLNELKEL
ncbi:MAG: bifunctional alpha,alpha-trehalose-phosphate synthase (UDP-forming)/trehalose-phosphatase [Thermoplasmatota archaeon]